MNAVAGLALTCMGLSAGLGAGALLTGNPGGAALAAANGTVWLGIAWFVSRDDQEVST